MNEIMSINPYGDSDGGQSLQSVTQAMATTRQAQEVQAAMVVAKRFPRDERQSMNRILQACTRKSLAEEAVYSYSRGGTEVTGPSIRLAEAMAQSWGNLDFGYIELAQKKGESEVMAYCWDLETNTRQSKTFTVPHIRHTKKGDYPLEDPRDIYEMIANQAARRIRSCILAIIPGDVTDAALKQCDATLLGGKQPLPDRIKDMVDRFAELEITPEQLRAFIGKNVDAFTVQDVVRLGKIYRSIQDGVVGNDYFITRMREAGAEASQEPQEAAPPTSDTPKSRKAAKSTQNAPQDEQEGMSLDDL